jgi:3-dehydro-L-gulonate-6-phosphate decarboxylase
MNLPMLQVALDNLSIADAFQTTRLIHEAVDIIEVGTILCLAEGMKAVKIMKAAYPEKIVLADVKAADAGQIIAKMAFNAHADWITVIGSADLPTAESALQEAKNYANKDVQIELTGAWSFEQAEGWRRAGIKQVVYHRSRDAQAAGVNWGQSDLDKIKRLSDMGFKVTVTGGLVLKDLDLFEAIPIYVFIAGRSIRDAKDPKAAALQFKRRLAELWG